MNARGRIAAASIALLNTALIFLLSSLPAGALPEVVPDFFGHWLEYLPLGFFFIQVFRRPARRATMALALFLLSALGLLDEVHQLSTPGRVFSWLDLLCDALGALAGMAAYRMLAARPARRWLDFLLLHR